ncbi:response regulator transcription factor [Paenibacillus luteus]|uniref:response regulator transcription factor n=1 Tax=Paenibacillus luteus TaxID=2545753 RepID=UPI0011416E2C|nr:response regulator [Paenibacillus luteus]
MKTIRVLLADDEPVILRGLQRLIPWSELGVEIVGEANDGNELRVMLDTCRPDIVISDISMPGLTGIDIIREINETGREIKVIFISAYQEFSYARDALKYGAVDYLIKPVDKERLVEVMNKAIRLIDEQVERVREKEMATQFERERRNDAIGELIERLTDGDLVAISQLGPIGVLTALPYTTVCFGELDGISLDGTNRWQEQERKLLDFSVSNILTEAIASSNAGIYFRKGDLHGLFVQHGSLDEPVALAQDLHAKINNYLKVSFTLGVGTPALSAEEACLSAKSAEQRLKVKYFEGMNRVIASQRTEPNSEARLLFEELQQQLISSLSRPPQDDREDIIPALLESVSLLSQGSKHAAVSAVYGTIIRLQRELKEIGIVGDSADSGQHALLEQLGRFQTFGELSEHAAFLFQSIRSSAASKLGNKELLQLLQVKAYIDEHYAENITLESIALLAFMNPYYFSSFFKKHTGENFKSYLTNVRMKHAHSLLMQTDLLVYEIAERVGYNNARQFSDMFKKIYGKLPLEFKQDMRGQGIRSDKE